MKEQLLYLSQAVPVFLYWGSLAFIGFAILKFILAKKKYAVPLGIASNPFLYALVSFATGVAAVSVVSVIGYIFRLPSVVFVIAWVVLLLAAIVYLAPAIKSRLLLVKTIKVGGIRFWLLGLLVLATIGALVVDYVLSTYFGAQFAEGSDSYVHVAKILSIATYGFSLDDGFMAGVLETRYHINAIYPLYMPIIHVLGISPADAWNLSAGFFRLIQWVSIGALAGFLYGRFAKKKHLPMYAVICVTTLAAIALFTSKWFLHVATYPNKVVILWFTLLRVGVILFCDRLQRDRKVGLYLAYVGAALTTLTHPTYALMAAVFIFALTVIFVVGRFAKWWRLLWRDVAHLLVLFVLLMLSPIVAVAFPDRMTQASFDFGDFKTTQVLGVDVLPIGLPNTLLSITIAVVALLGYAFMLVMAYRRRQYKVVAILAVIIAFPYLTMHNPLFMYIVGDRLPLWLVSRFSAMNILRQIVFIVGLYSVALLVYRLVAQRVVRRSIITALLIMVAVYLAISYVNGYKELRAGTKAIDHGYLGFIHRTQEDLRGVMPPGSLVVANLGDSYFLPAVIPIKVVAIHEAHATPMADSADRLRCEEQLLETGYDSRMLATIKADYVVLAKWQTNRDYLQQALTSRDDFTFVKETRDFFVYKVNQQRLDAAVTSGACYNYQRDEETLNDQ